MKTVCFFGIHDPSYARTRVLTAGFRAHDWRVIECRADPRRFPGISKYVELYRQYRRIRHESIDLVIIAFPGHTVVWLARLLFGKNIIFDAFLSLYDSNVLDRKVHRPYSFGALLDWIWDWSSIRLAKRVLLDTDAHIEYFVRTFGIARERCIRVWVGTDTTVFYPRLPETPGFAVSFHGTFIPLQGISYILDAAHILRDEPIHFNLIGKGQEYRAMREKAEHLGLANVRFGDPVPYEELPTHISGAQICLGIFGGTDKAMRVIPNKVYECMALGKPVITADTAAIHELEVYGSLPLVLVPPADATALAEAIRGLHADPARQARLGESARAFSSAYLSPAYIVGEFLSNLPPAVWRK